ncbi:MAG: DegQ family serine endoprotease [Alphaproteobacteria bacterium]
MHFGQGCASSTRPRALAAALAGLAALSLTLTPGFAQMPAAPPSAQTPSAAPQAQTAPASPSSQAQTQTGASDKNLTAQVPRSLPIVMPSLAPLVEHVSAAVVTISAQGGADRVARNEDDADNDDERPGGLPFEDFLRRFFERRGMPDTGREFVGLGSGFIIDPQGYIVTNNHVVSKASKITIILHDNSRHEAKIIGRDEKTDLALLKIDTTEKLPFVTWGDSEQAKVGDWIVAVGNPFGLGGTVTAGIISAVGRNINEGPYDAYIQIDAPINRGNSGGPAFNLGAEVIGVNTAIYSPSGGSVGIGFAVPSNVAKDVIRQLRETGRVTRGWLGVAIQGITPAIARSLGLNPDRPSGALVASVTANSPAAKAGIKQGDVITAAGGQPVKQVGDLPRIVAGTPPGQNLDLTILRSGQEIKLATTLGELSDSPKPVAAVTPDEDRTGALGLQLAAITPELRRQHRIPREVEGVVVTKVADQSPAASAGLQPGDVLVSVDQKPVTTPPDAAEQLKEAAAKGNILLLVNRRGSSQFVGLSVNRGSGAGSPG